MSLSFGWDPTPSSPLGLSARVADDLFGDAGDDLLYGGDGPDHIDGGPGSDTVTYAGTAAGVAVRVGATDVGAGEDTIEAVEVVIGSDGDDTLAGDGAANLLAGMRGDDEIAGGGGGDTHSEAAVATTRCTADPG